MAVSETELATLNKDELVTFGSRMARTAKRAKDKAKQASEDIMELAVAGGAAFATGYYIGNIKGTHLADGTDPVEDLKLFGMDKDLAAGIALTAVGITGMGGKKMAGAAKAAGYGVLAYWAGGKGEEIAITRATEEEG